MIRYRFNVADALERVGYNYTISRKTHIISSDSLAKLKKEEPKLSLKTLNTICNILDMQPKDILCFERDEDDEKVLQKVEAAKNSTKRYHKERE